MDQSLLKSDTALHRQGRTSGPSLLALGHTYRCTDQSGNTWLLLPTSKLKKDHFASTNTKPVYKLRVLNSMTSDALPHYVDLCTAETIDTIEDALSAMGLYDSMSGAIVSWKQLAKALDDWRCVLIGPAVADYWRHHHVELPDADLQNKHMRSLCFFCGASALWGPCEHQYAAMMHEGLTCDASPRARAKGRPKSSTAKQASKGQEALPQSAALVPGARVVQQQCPRSPQHTAKVAKASLSAADASLRDMLRPQ